MQSLGSSAIEWRVAQETRDRADSTAKGSLPVGHVPFRRLQSTSFNPFIIHKGFEDWIRLDPCAEVPCGSSTAPGQEVPDSAPSDSADDEDQAQPGDPLSNHSMVTTTDDTNVSTAAAAVPTELAPENREK